uniref:LIM zinc-binding domain-containing protein n=1 Tax=Macrostomum lignano TaxID=282301 RepID=A0A1I8HES2_9PLAT
YISHALEPQSLNCWKERRRQTLQNSGALQRLGLLEEQEAAESRREAQQAMEAARSRNKSIGRALKERARSLGHLDSEDYEEESKSDEQLSNQLQSTESESDELHHQHRSATAAFFERQQSQPAPSKTPSPPPKRRSPVAASFDIRRSPPQSPKRRSPVAASFDIRRSPPQSPKRRSPVAASFDIRRSPPQSPKRRSPVAASFDIRRSPPQSPKRRSPVAASFDLRRSPPQSPKRHSSVAASFDHRKSQPENSPPQSPKRQSQASSGVSAGFDRQVLQPAPSKSPPPPDQLSSSFSGVRVATGIGFNLSSTSAAAATPSAVGNLPTSPRSVPLPWERRQEFRPVSSKFNAAIAAATPRGRYADVSASVPHSRLSASNSLTAEGHQREPSPRRQLVQHPSSATQLLRQSMPDNAFTGKDPLKNLTNGDGSSQQKQSLQQSPQKLLQNQTIMEQHQDQRLSRLARRGEQLKHRSQSSDSGRLSRQEPGDDEAPSAVVADQRDFDTESPISPPQQQPPPPPLPPRISSGSIGNLLLQSAAPAPALVAPRSTGAKQQRERPLSVSGKKRCSHCFTELGSGGAMAIESLGLYYHIKCFKCCVCSLPLGNGTTGADVRVRRDRLHCPACFSSDEGIMSSVLGVV